jgi:hypothetical protein
MIVDLEQISSRGWGNGGLRQEDDGLIWSSLYRRVRWSLKPNANSTSVSWMDGFQHGMQTLITPPVLHQWAFVYILAVDQVGKDTSGLASKDMPVPLLAISWVITLCVCYLNMCACFDFIFDWYAKIILDSSLRKKTHIRRPDLLLAVLHYQRLYWVWHSW